MKLDPEKFDREADAMEADGLIVKSTHPETGEEILTLTTRGRAHAEKVLSENPELEMKMNRAQRRRAAREKRLSKKKRRRSN